MEHLTRTRVGRFRSEDAWTLDQVKMLREQGKLEECLLPVDQVFAELPAFCTLPEADKTAKNGNSIPERLVSRELPESRRELLDGGECRLYDSCGAFIGVYRYVSEEAYYSLVKMFYDGQEERSGEQKRI